MTTVVNASVSLQFWGILQGDTALLSMQDTPMDKQMAAMLSAIKEDRSNLTHGGGFDFYGESQVSSSWLLSASIRANSPVLCLLLLSGRAARQGLRIRV